MQDSTREKEATSRYHLGRLRLMLTGTSVSAALLLVHFLANVPSPLAAGAALLAACAVVCPASYLILRNYRNHFVTWTTLTGAVLVLTTQAIAFIEAIADRPLQEMVPWLSIDWPYAGDIRDALLMIGILLFFLAVFFSIFDAEQVKARLQERSAKLARDIAEQERAQEERQHLQRQMQQAQKLESLGVLAGGIAHDFNNLLMAILGNAELALDEISLSPTVRQSLEEIEAAAKRASELSRQMLAYSGRGRLTVQKLNLNALLREMEQLLHASASDSAMLKQERAESLPEIEADPAQIRQVVINLISNASEALGGTGGVISLSTGCRYLSAEALAQTYINDGLSEGRYVFLSVEDSGCGMDPGTLARVFDPFFSTKFSGRGLGLAVVLGIVRGHKGAILAESLPGRGSTFTVFFPAIDTAGVPVQEELPGLAPSHATKGAVLLVDDEEAVRKVGRRMLEKAAYVVITAPDGPNAIETFRSHSDTIGCILLDLSMPGMNGETVLAELRAIREDIPVVLCTGYDEELIAERFSGKKLAGVIQKPYQTATLLHRIEEIMG